jgi:hypothetical protein
MHNAVLAYPAELLEIRSGTLNSTGTNGGDYYSLAPTEATMWCTPMKLVASTASPGPTAETSLMGMGEILEALGEPCCIFFYSNYKR